MEIKSENVVTIRRPVGGAQAPPITPIKPTNLASVRQVKKPPSAVVYCEGNFAQTDGKTANGLVRH
ncbi:hypothetical protein C1J05_14080 [Sulfitobacter sp. JL08]|jgi:hypothetical protein|nr:hypothetical protein C1J05_14080 [Sulfitobacter sp. JL08]